MGKTIEELLSNPMKDVEKNVESINNAFFEKAQELMRNYCIASGDEIFYLAEVEFYYFEKDKWCDDWNHVTYARDGYGAGALFYHLSGIDICFESDCVKGVFGGILIRSILNKNESNIITGPLKCKDVILNACKNGNMPSIKPLDKPVDFDVKPACRFLGKTETKKEKGLGYKLCFYINRPIDCWKHITEKKYKIVSNNDADVKWILKTERSTKYYNLDRFFNDAPDKK